MELELSPIWIGIQGGTCAGKTTLAQALAQKIGVDNVLIVSLDLFYRPIEKQFVTHSNTMNFDAPSSLDWDLLRETTQRLRSGNSTTINIYDGLTLSQKLQLNPRTYTIIEGMWTFNEKFLWDLFDLSVYVDTSPDVRLIRRLRRDVINAKEWTLEKLLLYYMDCIRPMHLQFVELGKAFCHLLVNGENDVDVEVYRVLNSLDLNHRRSFS